MASTFAGVMRRLAGRTLGAGNCILIALIVLIFAVACSGGKGDLILATTTSTQDSGLLDVLVPEFQKQYDYNVKTIAVGSGEALRLGSVGEADVLLVHSPKAEEDFMAAGNGENRLLVMHNDFVIVGPSADPAGISESKTAADAFAKIATSEKTFLSRGDQSGTNTKELSIWDKAQIKPTGSWYQETGTGMGATLNVTNEKQGYTLSDRGTYLSQRANLDLKVLYEGDPTLNNIYHVIVVNSQKHDKVNAKGARDFAAFMTAAKTQEIIGKFGVDKVGQQLFIPDAASVTGASSSASPARSP